MQWNVGICMYTYCKSYQQYKQMFVKYDLPISAQDVFVSNQIHLFMIDSGGNDPRYIRWHQLFQFDHQLRRHLLGKNKTAEFLIHRKSYRSGKWQSSVMDQKNSRMILNANSQVGTCMKQNIFYALSLVRDMFFVFQESCTEMPRGQNSGPKTNPESKSLAFAIAPVTFPKTDKTINDIAASGLVDASPWDVGQTLSI